MIFLTLGTQLPFDRLVQALDDAALRIEEPIFGQIGNGKYVPRNFSFVDSMKPDEFSRMFSEARVIVGHAGIGTVLSGFKAEKPLVLMARKAAYGEHRNDHQVATIEQMRKFSGVYEAEDADSLVALLKSKSLKAMKMGVSESRNKLIAAIRNEIFGR